MATSFVDVDVDFDVCVGVVFDDQVHVAVKDQVNEDVNLNVLFSSCP